MPAEPNELKCEARDDNDREICNNPARYLIQFAGCQGGGGTWTILYCRDHLIQPFPWPNYETVLTINRPSQFTRFYIERRSARRG